MRLLLPRRVGRIGLVAAIALALTITSTAVAYWRTSGGGTGSGAVGAPQALIVGSGTPTAPLYPGGQGDVALTIANPNPSRVHVGSLSLDTSQGTAGFGVDAGHTACTLSALSFTAQTNGGLGWTVPPKVGSTNGSLSLDLPNAATLSTGAANACQGASFVVYLTEGP